MKMFLIISMFVGLFVTFCLWCCIYVGAQSDRYIEDVEKIERSQQKGKGASDG